jgi:hypothetical protein
MYLKKGSVGRTHETGVCGVTIGKAGIAGTDSVRVSSLRNDFNDCERDRRRLDVGSCVGAGTGLDGPADEEDKPRVKSDE